MTNLEKAKKLFNKNNYTCVLCKGEDVYSSIKRGVAPLLYFIDNNIDLTGFSATDKVVGKGVAFLFAYTKVKAVYAIVMSKQAIEVFEKYGIEYSYNNLVDSISNDAGDDICPMEQVTQNIDNPQDAIVAIRAKIEELKSKNQK